MPDIFLSYNREDKAVAQRFTEAFEARGYRVWWDVVLRSGETYDEATENALKSAKAVVVLWSKKSAASRWVRAEATLADRRGTLLPVMIEPCERPIMFELIQSAELAHWNGEGDDPAWMAFAAEVERMIEKHQPAPAPPAPPVRAGERGGAPSMAVLPFANRSGLAEDEVFADGMVEDLVAAMSRGFSVRVLTSGATSRFRKGAFTDITAVGRELGVRYLLEGNLRRSGDTLRVATQVVEAETGEVLWSGRFDRPLSELARLQEELVMEVFSTLEVRFQTIEIKRALKKPADITAWEAVNRAFAAQSRGGPAGLTLSLEEAQRAIAIDPDYALAHAAFAHAMAVHYLYTSPPDDATEQLIRQHVDRALTLGSDDLYALGTCSQALCCIGRPDEALTLMQRGVRQAPLVGPFHVNLGWACALLNRTKESLSHLAEADRLMPDWSFQSLIRALQANAMVRDGDWKGAEATIDQVLAVHPDDYTARQLKAVACMRADREDEARTVFGPVTASGLPLEQVLTFTRRAYVNNSIVEEICTTTRTLWAATAR